MVGAEIAAAGDPGGAGRAGAARRSRGVSTPDGGGLPGLRAVDLALRGGRITGLAGVSGNGQAALAGLIAGVIAPARAEMLTVSASRSGRAGRRARRSAAASRASPRTATAPAASAAMSLPRTPSSRPTARRRSAAAAGSTGARRERFAEGIIARLRRALPGAAGAASALLSGGNMQKLILGRALSTGAADHPRQPADARARRRARSPTCTRGCSRRARAARRCC